MASLLAALTFGLALHGPAPRWQHAATRAVARAPPAQLLNGFGGIPGFGKDGEAFGLSKRERTRLSRLRRPEEPLEEELSGLALLGGLAGAVVLGGPIGALVGFNLGPLAVRAGLTRG